MSERDAPKSPPARRSGSGFFPKLLLASISLLLTLGLLLATEGALRLVGIGAPRPGLASRLKYQQLDLPLLEAAHRADQTPIFRSADSRLSYQSLRAEKPADGLRVLVFGGSATAGLGYGPNLAFARLTHRLLEAAEPGRPIEVFNFGIVALASQQVRALVEDACRRYAPDVVVVYSGNNEFLELHAELYSKLHASALDRASDLLKTTHLFRLLGGLAASSRRGEAVEGSYSNDDLRLSERALVRNIELSPRQVEEVLDRYEANLRAMVDATESSGAGLVLMDVASNWRWRGREDLPNDWQREWVPGAPAGHPIDPKTVRAALDEALEKVAVKERWELLFRRAISNESMGEVVAARDDYRAALASDPHLRRATPDLNARLHRVAKERTVSLIGTEAILAAHAPDGIIGFETFYDYVHFTPRGAWLTAGALFETLQTNGWSRPEAGFDAVARVAGEIDKLETRHDEPLPVDEWMGIADSTDEASNRDLWKYEKLVKTEEAAAHYRAALETHPEDPVARANLDRIRREGRL
jgi:tetratricopeptide (TPR) repeat protein